MRFYFGVSKKLNIKTVIFLLGLAFIGLLAFFGLTEHAFAWTKFNTSSNDTTGVKNAFPYWKSNGVNFYSSSEGSLVNYYCDVINDIYCGWNVSTSNNSTKYWSTLSSGVSSENWYTKGSFYLAIQKGFPSNSNLAPTQRGVTTDYEIISARGDYCSSSSMNIKGSFIYSYSSFASSLSNYTSAVTRDTAFYTKVNAYDDDNDRVYITSCTTSFNSVDSNYSYLNYYNFTCNNAYVSSDIDYYSIEIGNNVPFEDFYRVSGTNGLNGTVYYNIGTYDLSSQPTLQYECSSDSPVVDNNPIWEPTIPDVPNPNNVFCTLFGNCSNDNPEEYIPSLSSVTSLLTAPMRMLHDVGEEINSGSSCSNLELPLSMSYIGFNGETNGYDKNLELPCGDIMWSHFPEVVVNIYYVLIFGLFAYKLLLDFAKFINRTVNPEDSQEYFMDL